MFLSNSQLHIVQPTIELFSDKFIIVVVTAAAQIAKYANTWNGTPTF